MSAAYQRSQDSLGWSPASVRRGCEKQRNAFSPLITLIGFYCIGIALGVLIFVMGFVTKSFSSVGIFFYRGLVIVAAAAAIHSIVMAFALLRLGAERLSPANLVSVVALSAMLNLTFFTLVPVNLDRSISVFLLAWMGNSEARPMDRADLHRVFETVYVTRYDAIDRRINEQIVSGNIRNGSHGFVLTARGQLFNRFARTVGTVFSVDPRFLDPHCVPAERNSGLAGCERLVLSKNK